MSILAIETTGLVCGVAVHDGSRVLADVHVRAARVHDAVLAAQVTDVCAQAGIAVREVEAVACSVGPGSFTGIRIGLAMAKGLCMSAGVPLVGVPTLDALAHAARDEAARLGAAGIVATANAGTGKHYWCFYTANGTRTQEYATGVFDRATVPDDHLVIGEAGTYFGSSLPANGLERLRLPLPSHVAVLGAERYRRGRRGEPSEVQPLYVTPVSHRTIDLQGKP